MKARDLTVRAATDDDRELLRAFRCSGGQPWEDHVEDQVRGPLTGRYLASPPMFAGRLLLGLDGEGTLLAIGDDLPPDGSPRAPSADVRPC